MKSRSLIASAGCLLFFLWSGWGGYVLWCLMGWWDFVAPWRLEDMPTVQVILTAIGLVCTAWWTVIALRSRVQTTK